jgi:hypothetical protein
VTRSPRPENDARDVAVPVHEETPNVPGHYFLVEHLNKT